MKSIPMGLTVIAFGLAAWTSPVLAAEEGARPAVKTVTCVSTGAERQHCPADTSKGVALLRTVSNEAPCILGRSWGYDATGIWVSDGCSAEFLPGQELPKEAAEAAIETPEAKKKFLEHIPNQGYRLFGGKDGEIFFRIFTYVRYLNQKGLDPTYTDSFGTTRSVQQREDVQIQKVMMFFSGWFLSPKVRYLAYVWTSNVAQGDPAQVVVAGNLSYIFNKYVVLGIGIAGLPTVRSTEGQWPYWLGVDNRLTADEFFRGSYTTGVWLKGAIVDGVNYMAMVGNNLSQLGISASQLDAGLHTQSFGINWMPTTKEFGYFSGFGDYDAHEKVATRLGAHFTHSREDKQTQPGTNSIENSQIRLSDGNVIFTPNLFGPGITVERVTYQMSSVDAGVKYKGLSLEGEYYWRWLSNFAGSNTGGIPESHDHGFQIQSSAMVIPKTLQLYLSGSEIRGFYGNASEVRGGLNWYFLANPGIRVNAEWIHLNHSPVGYTAVPYPVGGNGDLYHTNVELNF